MLIFILMALLMPFQGNSNYLLSISEPEIKYASLPAPRGDPGSGDSALSSAAPRSHHLPQLSAICSPTAPAAVENSFLSERWIAC